MIQYNTEGKYKIFSHTTTSCDSFECRKEFSELIKRTGKKRYQRTHEWCCGNGAIGLELLGNNITKELVLTDKHPICVMDCMYTVSVNNLQSKVTVYRKDLLSDIDPSKESWDLFVANPPWRSQQTDEECEWTLDDKRRMIDEEWKVHINLWNHLSKYLTDDGDAYIYEDRRFSSEELWSQCWKVNDLYLHDVYENFGALETGYVMHIKINK